jgi:hypothetical protein
MPPTVWFLPLVDKNCILWDTGCRRFFICLLYYVVLQVRHVRRRAAFRDELDAAEVGRRAS